MLRPSIPRLVLGERLLELLHDGVGIATGLAHILGPLLLQRLDSELLNRLIDKLPIPYREILVLREIEDLSYREIADILVLPIGTVMSRLARARERLQRAARGSIAPRLVK